MASNEELDLDVKQGGGGKKQLILYIVIGVLVLALGAVAALLLLKGDDKKEEAAAAGGGEHAAPAEMKQVHYLAIDKLIVNFGQGSPVRFLQVNLQLMSHDPEALGTLTTHMPVVRNDILLLLGSQKYEMVSTNEGKLALQVALQQKVQEILDTHAHGKTIEAVYFTEFVMQ